MLKSIGVLVSNTGVEVSEDRVLDTEKVSGAQLCLIIISNVKAVQSTWKFINDDIYYRLQYSTSRLNQPPGGLISC
jgi:hypothetical protein